MGPFECGFSTTECDVQAVFPISSTEDRFDVFVETSPGSGNSWTLTFRVAGADTAFTCTISGSATQCQDLTHSGSISAGNAISVKLVSSGVPTST